MAIKINKRDLSQILSAAKQWIDKCLIEDRAVLSNNLLWTPALIEEVRKAFVEHLDTSKDDFMTKLKGQMKNCSPAAQQLMAEMIGRCFFSLTTSRPRLSANIS